MITKNNPIVKILVRRDNMTTEDAIQLVEDARADLMARLAEGEYPEDICEEWFALEPDYIPFLDLI